MVKRKIKAEQADPTKQVRGSLLDVISELPKSKPKTKPKSKRESKPKTKPKTKRESKPKTKPKSKPKPDELDELDDVRIARRWHQVFVRAKPKVGKDPVEILPNDQVTYWSREGGSYTQIAEGMTAHKVDLAALIWSPDDSDVTFEVRKARCLPLGQVQSVHRLRKEPKP